MASKIVTKAHRSKRAFTGISCSCKIINCKLTYNDRGVEDHKKSCYSINNGANFTAFR